MHQKPCFSTGLLANWGKTGGVWEKRKRPAWVRNAGGVPETVAPEQTLAEQLEELPHDELVRIVETMEEDMRNASAAMDFEEAARLRDAVVQIRAMLEGASEDETIERLRSQARKGSSFASGRKRQGARFKK